MTQDLLKLHLGCGMKRLEGYRNIDFPLDHHSVQTVSVADETADLANLRYAAGTVGEVRLHHVFEHFPRPQAVALVACWRSWMPEGGLLRVEVPDFDRTARAALRPWAGRRAKSVAIRHLFGSHEAHWAAHWEGWSRDSLKALLAVSGFGHLRFTTNQWLGTYNIEVEARAEGAWTRARAEAGGRSFLADYLVDSSANEARLLEVWMDACRRQWDLGWAM